ncbi:uroporphyrinogen-III synthase [Caenispirillum bisanense]|uniref:Uroporphyrinogen-III synthase n=1 Tax=Caenispirillum bisanense TaxID=414052 RepID=A0A286GTQ0_9PROT|nr:uroporphyrinogen-III synthase [Caenispirillum bisanense]SOD98915.1 uroporphyrinogen-III synthase [Caenispirillum bisanense]
MRVLITRPLHDARRTARLLEDRGVEAVIEPLFSISYIPAAAVALDGVQGYLVTSANGVRALAQALPADNPLTRELPVYAVGDATAETAREHDFTQVLAAEGDVTSLARLVRARVRPPGGTLVHAAGTELAGDLAGELEAAGYTVRRERLYETRAAVALSRDTQRLIATRALHAALFYSPRTARIFAELAQRADLADACRDIRAYCLSEAVAKDLGGVPFAHLRVAATPTQEALLALLDEDRAAGAYADAEGGAVMTDRPEKDAKETEDKTKAEATAAPSGPAPDPAKAGAGDASGARKAGGVGSVPPATASTGTSSATVGGGTPKPTSSSSAATASASSPSTSSAAASTPAKKSGGGGGKAIAAILVLLVLVVLVGFATLPWWRDSAPEPLKAWLPAPPQETARVAELSQQNQQLQSDVQSLRQRLEQVTAQLGDVEGRVAEAGQGGGASPELQQQVQDMQAQLQTLLSGMDPQALQSMAQAGEQAQARLDALAEELDQLRRGTADAQTVLAMQERLQEVAAIARQTASRQDTALGLMLTTAQLRQAVDQGNPFATELRTVRAIADGMSGVTIDAPVLADFADAGIPTRDMLQERFGRLGTEIIRAAAAPDDAPEWVQSTVKRLMGLVTVRRTDGEAVGDGASAVVARAASALEAGDLATAVAELKKLQGDAAVVADDWLAGAEARLAADKALADLTSESLARFAAAQRGGDAAGAGSGGAEAAQAQPQTGG